MRLADSESEPEVAPRESQSAQAPATSSSTTSATPPAAPPIRRRRPRAVPRVGGTPRGKNGEMPAWMAVCMSMPVSPKSRNSVSRHGIRWAISMAPAGWGFAGRLHVSKDHLKRVARQESLNALFSKAVGLVGQHRHAKCLSLQPLEQRIHARVGQSVDVPVGLIDLAEFLAAAFNLLVGTVRGGKDVFEELCHPLADEIPVRSDRMWVRRRNSTRGWPPRRYRPAYRAGFRRGRREWR